MATKKLNADVLLQLPSSPVWLEACVASGNSEDKVQRRQWIFSLLLSQDDSLLSIPLPDFDRDG